ncbi:hydantoinase B/oxoprolinase family protein [Alkalilimnicola sp. S0819]|uniref:hydantoinase B/oxoprolinase family protein n=1 Tax=Alkalilimnicola sp. S0819 TaxID=2613922 RepID=UPI001261E12B|nr:hydantoinase B/oxoprolinase family protein [Alkalilimnicola sp. S0819]KAB7623188.1 hydantoinase B/oxoprolinase family protein [Alkalilimnicola sp. S0819]MPQ17034.1 hydantoinase B/oxoprolinase family protein [Alkalilimnicola sp. S0819]
MNPVELGIFSSRLGAVCDEMGAVLQRSAFSPNIRDRLDFSCAVFDAEGALAAQAAHIPVHLGSMAYAMGDLVQAMDWRPGDMVVLNDPYLGGTHLPDVTLVAPVFIEEQLLGFVANRAHHADIGAITPGSMPLSSRLEEEGVVIPPSYLYRAGELCEELLARIAGATRNARQTRGDFSAQASSARTGVGRLQALVRALGVEAYLRGLTALNDYAERLVRAALAELPAGEFRYTDYLDDDGQGNVDLPVSVTVRVGAEGIRVDFTGTAPQTSGNINCPVSVAAAAVYYVFRCLMPPQTPACAGAFRPVSLSVPDGCLLNARRPAAVAAGNVETSTRVVDALMGALAQALPERLAGASHGSMNNLAMGAPEGEPAWDYYETLGGGMGAGERGGGLDAVQTHMTNTLNTPVEALEMAYPLRVRHYGVRRGSGGAGRRAGGCGLVREYEFLAPAVVTLLTERRRHRPWGLAGGEPGAAGRNLLNGETLPPKATVRVASGDRLRVETPGGGGWGNPEPFVRSEQEIGR